MLPRLPPGLPRLASGKRLFPKGGIFKNDAFCKSWAIYALHIAPLILQRRHLIRNRTRRFLDPIRLLLLVKLLKHDTALRWAFSIFLLLQVYHILELTFDLGWVQIQRLAWADNTIMLALHPIHNLFYLIKLNLRPFNFSQAFLGALIWRYIVVLCISLIQSSWHIVWCLDWLLLVGFVSVVLSNPNDLMRPNFFFIPYQG